MNKSERVARIIKGLSVFVGVLLVAGCTVNVSVTVEKFPPRIAPPEEGEPLP